MSKACRPRASKSFYDTFYYPNNATAILVGDFERAGALELINKYFGSHRRLEITDSARSTRKNRRSRASGA